MTATLAVDGSNRHELVRLAAQQQPLPSPVEAYFEVANRCNSKCVTCPVTFSPLENARQLSLDEFEQLVDQGTALPCCSAPFTDAPYDSITLGNYLRDGVQAVWTGAAYQQFRERLYSSEPPPSCRNCGLAWSL